MDLNKLYKEIEEAEVSLNAKRLKYIEEALAENNGIIKLKFKEFKETNDAFDFDDQFPVIIEINGIPMFLTEVYVKKNDFRITALLGQQKLKESFVKDLELVLSRKNPNIEKGKLNFIRYSEMKNWSVRELFGEDLEQADRALINKVYHMLFDIGSDFESVIRMLYSFRNGPKSGIKVADPEDNYEWTNKDGNEKYSTKNLPKAHFRWDWRRYTLSKESVDKITEFVDTILES